jgi:hypothetical protein
MISAARMSINISIANKEKTNNDKQDEKEKKQEKDELKSKVFVEIATAVA